MATVPVTETPEFLQFEPKKGRRLSFKPAHPPVELLSQNEFLRILRVERKRTERSKQPFMLMQLEGNGLFAGFSADKMVRQLSQVLASATRETDIQGWYAEGEVFGVIFAEMGSAADSPVIIRKVTSALQRALTPAQFDQIKLSFRLFPELPSGDGDNEPDFTFYPDLERHSPSSRVQLWLKRSIDIFVSMIALIVLAPVFGAVALMVKLTSEGPILFRQSRVGQYGKRFTFLKFRSMFTNNDSKIHQQFVADFIAGKNAIKQPDGTTQGAFKLTKDPRITPVGRFLRKTSLDELPQLFNVIKGEMSLVGPRPPLPYEFEKYDIWHRRRVIEIKPGITGLWQVDGRSKTTFDEMVRLDLKYLRLRSLWLDLKILAKTPAAVLSGEGAH